MRLCACASVCASRARPTPTPTALPAKPEQRRLTAHTPVRHAAVGFQLPIGAPFSSRSVDGRPARRGRGICRRDRLVVRLEAGSRSAQLVPGRRADGSTRPGGGRLVVGTRSARGRHAVGSWSARDRHAVDTRSSMMRERTCASHAIKRLPLSQRQRRLALRARSGQQAGNATHARPAARSAARTVAKYREVCGSMLDRAPSWQQAADAAGSLSKFPACASQARGKRPRPRVGGRGRGPAWLCRRSTPGAHLDLARRSQHAQLGGDGAGGVRVWCRPSTGSLKRVGKRHTKA